MNHLLNFILLGFIGPQEIIIIFLFSGLSIIPFIFYLITLQKTLYAVSIENRKMPPEQVWLSLIPLFGLVWQFIIVNRIADSLKFEFASKGIRTDEERPGISLGLAYCILFCCSIIPFLGFLTSIGGFICWIIYWVKIGEYKNKLIYS
ncbi:MAG: hypothetical protein JXR31_11360 [Prolixibacteraceae bacterium]|nr:hypothetical protein [Prolixibacteraceae bacterium]MBN2774840.1 hypothetical protein [Prolixibacteraceae bacterium]